MFLPLGRQVHCSKGYRQCSTVVLAYVKELIVCKFMECIKKEFNLPLWRNIYIYIDLPSVEVLPSCPRYEQESLVKSLSSVTCGSKVCRTNSNWWHHSLNCTSSGLTRLISIAQMR